MAIPAIVEQYHELSQNFPEYLAKLKAKYAALLLSLQTRFPSLGVLSSEFDIFSHFDSGVLKNIGLGVKSTLLQGYSTALTVANLALLPFITYYLALDFDRLHHEILDFVPPRFRPRLVELCGEIDGDIKNFVAGQVLVALVLAGLYSIGLGLVGIDLWLLIGVTAGLLNVVPYLGFLIGIVLSSIMALLTFGDFIHVAYVWGVFMVVQGLEGMVITPKILGDKVGISPLLVILAIFAGGKLFGLLGVFLAVPGAAVLRILLRHLHTEVVKFMEPDAGAENGGASSA